MNLVRSAGVGARERVRQVLAEHMLRPLMYGISSDPWRLQGAA